MGTLTVTEKSKILKYCICVSESSPEADTISEQPQALKKKLVDHILKKSRQGPDPNCPYYKICNW